MSDIFSAIRADIAEWEPGYTGEHFIVISDIPGYGIHTHGSNCRDNCMRDCDNSDRIVTVEYSPAGYQAVYGILDGKISLWMN